MKLAIVKSQKDLLRVIPILKGSTIEFKISTLGNNYSIEYWHQGIHNPEVYTTSSEITYHSSLKKSGKMLPGVVHVKEGDRISSVDYKYKFPKVTDILIDSEFPVPLFKLTIAESMDTIYNGQPYHFVLDFDSPEIAQSNVLEVYIVSKHFDYSRFINKWPNISGLWQVTSIDYVTKGVYLSQHFLNMLKSGEPFIGGVGYDFKDFHFIFRPYINENVEANTICFYENYDYISMLGTSPVQLIDDRTKRPLSKINPAFYYDLNRQIRDRRTSKGENELWNNFFKVSYEHISKLNIKRKGFLLPQI